MVKVGDKITISQTKDGGYVGTKSGTPRVGDKISTNQYGWKSGTPRAGDILIMNQDTLGRNLARKSGGGRTCPTALNVETYYKVNDSYHANVPSSGRNGWTIYSKNGWSRDTDHYIAGYSYFSPDCTFTAIVGSGSNHSYWLSTATTYITNGGCDDDFTLYINGSRSCIRKYSGGAYDYQYGICLDKFLVDGTNTVKMFFKDWFGVYFSYSSVYVLDICNDGFVYVDESGSEPVYTAVSGCFKSYRLNDVLCPDTYTYDTPTFTIDYDGTETDVVISGSPYAAAPLSAACSIYSTFPCYIFYSVIVNGVNIGSYPHYQNASIKNYLSIGDNTVFVHYERAAPYYLRYISQAYVLKTYASLED